MVVALVLPVIRLDYWYCNSLLVGLQSANSILLLQPVQNAAARLIFGLLRSKHIMVCSQSSLILRSRAHPLQSHRRLLTYRAVNSSAPVYVPVILLHPSR